MLWESLRPDPRPEGGFGGAVPYMRMVTRCSLSDRTVTQWSYLDIGSLGLVMLWWIGWAWCMLYWAWLAGGIRVVILI